MSERDIGMALAALTEAFAMKVTPVRVRVYVRALEKVPVPLLQPMVEKAVATRKFFPKASELLEDAEACRKELLAAQKFTPCDDCHGTGWSEVETDGVKRATRCVCYRAYQQKLASLGVGPEPLALPPARDWTQIGDDAV